MVESKHFTQSFMGLYYTTGFKIILNRLHLIKYLINLVVVNLYPTEKVCQKTDLYNEIIENIDIGGHTLIRFQSKIILK